MLLSAGGWSTSSCALLVALADNRTHTQLNNNHVREDGIKNHFAFSIRQPRNPFRVSCVSVLVIFHVFKPISGLIAHTHTITKPCAHIYTQTAHGHQSRTPSRNCVYLSPYRIWCVISLCYLDPYCNAAGLGVCFRSARVVVVMNYAFGSSVAHSTIPVSQSLAVVFTKLSNGVHLFRTICRQVVAVVLLCGASVLTVSVR